MESGIVDEPVSKLYNVLHVIAIHVLEISKKPS